LLHACCHNPTGVDLTNEQWAEVISIFKSRGLVAFVDMAYQGFGDGIEEDAFAPRAFARAGIPTLVANSFSKNFSLYGERCGGLSVVCKDSEECARVLSQLNATVRANYSNPPTHGARIISEILTDTELRNTWSEELGSMRDRILSMRQAIHDGLSKRVSGELLEHYLSQRGMFTYTGLDAQQVETLRTKEGVYLLKSGRMCVAGLNYGNVDRVVQAISGVMQAKR
jgi:aromatic-amino-acid transaminase